MAGVLRLVLAVLGFLTIISSSAPTDANTAPALVNASNILGLANVNCYNNCYRETDLLCYLSSSLTLS